MFNSIFNTKDKVLEKSNIDWDIRILEEDLDKAREKLHAANNEITYLTKRNEDLERENIELKKLMMDKIKKDDEEFRKEIRNEIKDTKNELIELIDEKIKPLIFSDINREGPIPYNGNVMYSLRNLK